MAAVALATHHHPSLLHRCCSAAPVAAHAVPHCAPEQRMPCRAPLLLPAAALLLGCRLQWLLSSEACAVLACRVWTWYTYLHTRLYLSILVCDIIYTWRLEGVGTLSRRRRRGGCRQLQATTDFFLQLVVAVRLVRRMACVDARA